MPESVVTAHSSARVLAGKPAKWVFRLEGRAGRNSVSRCYELPLLSGSSLIHAVAYKLSEFYEKNRSFKRSWGSSVSIVSDYRLDDRGSIPGRGKGFFL
jgi:hypothetical protein